MSRFMISAAGKSSGKTVVAMGLCRSLVDAGHTVQPFKKGPDYIDPMWLAAASAKPCFNLDFNTMTTSELEVFFQHRQVQEGINIVEGNKGLYDGVDLHGADCNAALAALLDLPVVLVINCSGITRGIAPLLNGYAAFGDDIEIAGVILNNVGGTRHHGKLVRVIEAYTDMTVLGSVARSDNLAIEERHLGLTTRPEHEDAERLVTAAARAVREGVDIPGIFDNSTSPGDGQPRSPGPSSAVASGGIQIGVARDSAFCFYYPDDLERLEQLGAELVFLDFIHDTRIPEIDALFIGGGFPETQMEALSLNQDMRNEVRRVAQSGIPVYAECGGLMYLCNSISWHGTTREMSGVVDADITVEDRPVGRGYVALETSADHPWRKYFQGDATVTLTAHEFHHSRLVSGGNRFKSAYRVTRGYGIDGSIDGIVQGNVVANYCHLRSTPQFPWADYFFRQAADQRAATH